MTVTPALVIHVGAGSIGFIAGATALSVRKGAVLHRAFGNAFFVSMLVMAATAGYLSLLRQPGTFLTSILTLYFVATSWATIRRKEGSTGLFEKAAFVAILCCMVGFVVSGIKATHAVTGQFEGYPAGIYFFWSIVAALAATQDLKVILRGGISGARRIARHLWRMCFAFFIGAASASAQLERMLPATVHGVSVSYVLLAMAFAPLLLMAFWLIRVRFTNWFKNDDIQKAAIRARPPL